MQKNKSFFPINNHYSSIDLPTLKANNFKTPSIKIKGIENSSILEIAKYSNQLFNNSENKNSIIINSKQNIDNQIESKDSNSLNKNIFLFREKVVDMLTINPKKVKDTNIEKILVQRYLKSFTTLDIALAQNQNTTYEFYSKTLNLKILHKNVYKVLESSLFEMSSVISRPSFHISPNNVIINLFYFVANKKLSTKDFLELNENKLQGLSTKLSTYFKKPVTLEFTQLYSITNNSQILAHVLGKLALSRKNSFSRIIGRFLKYNSNKIFFRKRISSRFATLLTGVYIKLGGRLMRGKIVPRRTVKKIQYGSLARSKSNYITEARCTQKNKRGSFSFTVSIGHKFF